MRSIIRCFHKNLSSLSFPSRPIRCLVPFPRTNPSATQSMTATATAAISAERTVTTRMETTVATPLSNKKLPPLQVLSQKDNAHPVLTVHSTFRDKNGQQVFPHGLDWHSPGTSQFNFVPASEADATKLLTIMMKQHEDAHREDCFLQLYPSIIHAYNKWCFAKDLPFRKMEDIERVQCKNAEIFEEEKDTTKQQSPPSFQVIWKDDDAIGFPPQDESRFTIQEIDGLLRIDKSVHSKSNNGHLEPPAQVWINGMFVGMLQPDTLDEILCVFREIQTTTKIPKWVYRKSTSRGIIRIERRFTGMIRWPTEVVTHVLDNVYALEDVKMIDDTTLIGTATLPDWIMGGELTSRLWLQYSKGTLVCKRPLYNDNLESADRSFTLQAGKYGYELSLFLPELQRLRYLATLPSPYNHQNDNNQQPAESDNNEYTDDGFTPVSYTHLTLPTNREV